MNCQTCNKPLQQNEKTTACNICNLAKKRYYIRNKCKEFYRKDQIELIVTISTSSKEVMNIIGAAGTGKTYALAYFQGVRTQYLAPTNKAAKALREKLNDDSKVSTIHKFLKGEICYDQRGNQDFDFKLDNMSEDIIRGTNLVIIDESSMITKKMYESLMKFQALSNCKIVFVGDNCQLAPIEKKSIFDNTKKKQSIVYDLHPVDFELTENIRNCNPKYDDLLKTLRKLINTNTYTAEEIKLVNSKLDKVLDNKTTSKVIIKDYINKKWENSVVLAYKTGRTGKYNRVGDLNKMIRDIKFDYPDDQFVTGELIQFTDYYNQGEKKYYTCDTATVIEVTTGIVEFFDQEVEVYILLLSDETIINYPVDLNHFKILENKYKDITRADKQRNNKEKWESFYNQVASVCAPIDYRYALSIHKSQGSTYKYCYVNINDFAYLKSFELEQYYKLLYVAISRTTTNSRTF